MIKTAAVQTSPVLGEKKLNISRTIEMMKTVEANLFVLPELFSTGYAFRSLPELEALSEHAEGPTLKSIHEFSISRNTWVCGGFAEKSREGIYNSSFLIGPTGLAGVYRKSHLFGAEKGLFIPGDSGFQVFDIGIARVGMMICFDWIFPEAARTLALKGADIILHCANLILPYGPDAMITRCLENRIYAVTSNRVGCEKGLSGSYTFIGTSQVISPRAQILCRASRDKEEVVTAQIDPAVSRNKDFAASNNLFTDRRKDLYEI